MDGGKQPPAEQEQSSSAAAPENDTSQLQSLLSNADTSQIEAQRLPDADENAEEQQQDAPSPLNADM